MLLPRTLKTAAVLAWFVFLAACIQAEADPKAAEFEKALNDITKKCQDIRAKISEAGGKLVEGDAKDLAGLTKDCNAAAEKIKVLQQAASGIKPPDLAEAKALHAEHQSFLDRDAKNITDLPGLLQKPLGDKALAPELKQKQLKRAVANLDNDEKVGLARIQTAQVPFARKTGLPTAVTVVPPRKGKSETVKLFNGKDLDGWEGHARHWSIKEGAIVGKSTDEVKVSTYLLTKRKFSDFRLTAKVKLVQSEMHSGIAMWGRLAPEQKDPYTYAGHLVMFPTNWGMYDLYGRNMLPVDREPAKKVGKQHDWNDLEILAQGNRVRVAANGVAVVDWYDPEPDRIKEAPIGLQLHSNMVPQEVHFKDLILTTFPEEDKLTTVK